MNNRDINAVIIEARKTTNDHQAIITAFWDVYEGMHPNEMAEVIELLLPDRIRALQTQSMKRTTTQVNTAVQDLKSVLPVGVNAQVKGMTDKQILDRVPVAEPWLVAVHQRETQSIDRFGIRKRLIELTVEDLRFFADRYGAQASALEGASRRCLSAATMLVDRNAQSFADIKQPDQRNAIYNKLGNLPTI